MLDRVKLDDNSANVSKKRHTYPKRIWCYKLQPESNSNATNAKKRSLPTSKGVTNHWATTLPAVHSGSSTSRIVTGRAPRLPRSCYKSGTSSQLSSTPLTSWSPPGTRLHFIQYVTPPSLISPNSTIRIIDSIRLPSSFIHTLSTHQSPFSDFSPAAGVGGKDARVGVEIGKDLGGWVLYSQLVVLSITWDMVPRWKLGRGRIGIENGIKSSNLSSK